MLTQTTVRPIASPSKHRYLAVLEHPNDDERTILIEVSTDSFSEILDSVNRVRKAMKLTRYRLAELLPILQP
jgi:hypothetical protein